MVNRSTYKTMKTPSIENLSPYNQAITDSINRIAPLWPLDRFVAVNPFVGLSNHRFDQALELLKQNTTSNPTLPPSYYHKLYTSGQITPLDLEKAIWEMSAKRGASVAGKDALINLLSKESWEATNEFPKTQNIDHNRWGNFATEEISKWCAAYYDKGQALWGFPWKGASLYDAWRQAALLDLNPEAAGLRGWRSYISTLSDDPVAAIDGAARNLNLTPEEATEAFHQLLMSVSGWAGYLAFLAHEKKLQGKVENSLTDLLAIRMVFESALFTAFGESAVSIKKRRLPCASDNALIAALVWQRAHECARQRILFGKLSSGRASVVHADSTPSFQAVFCIDVRSEVYRRALENVDSRCQTRGFAGFFGFPIEFIRAGESSGSPQCPVLLAPTAKVSEKTSAHQLGVIANSKKIKAAWSSFKSSAVSSFVFVEAAGLGFLSGLVRNLTGTPRTPHCSPSCMNLSAISLEQKVAISAGALRHMGLSKGGLAPIVLLCGHGSSTINNPYGSALDCGACGGHTGEANARTAAAILNDPEVRNKLGEMGISIPSATWFMAGLHNTTIDTVELYDEGIAPSSHQAAIRELKESLRNATALARQDKAISLGIPAQSTGLDDRITRRSKDWSQVRPEWGLAGNFAFIAASRERTRGINLEGRVFLNDYDFAKDDEMATLELLLTAPVVVASWINLQYYGSTVDNKHFGSGDKTINNVVGKLGVLEGNGGDIKTGLPLQSLHDGTHWRHEPLRLSVCIEAPKEAIDTILRKHPKVAELVSNEWIHLFSINDSENAIWKSDGGKGWVMN
jgi:uncharacterized protein YbcC (UPF0753/DUF2309 family)